MWVTAILIPISRKRVALNRPLAVFIVSNLSGIFRSVESTEVRDVCVHHEAD
jgi:hypothetical protein